MRYFVKKHFVLLYILLKYNFIRSSSNVHFRTRQPSIRLSATRFFNNFTYKIAFRFPLSVFRSPFSVFGSSFSWNVKFARKLDLEKHVKNTP